MSTNTKEVKVLIVSCNPFVSDFLRGIVEAHGYSTEAVSDFYKAQVRMKIGWPNFIFIYDSCFEWGNLKNFELRTRRWTHKGIPLILLANTHTKQQVEELPMCKLLQIVEKPVGYLQIGHLMSDLVNAKDEKR